MPTDGIDDCLSSGRSRPLSSSFVLAPMAIAEDSPPTDAQLQSAYCIPVLRWQSQQQRQMVAAVSASPKNDEAGAKLLADSRRALTEADDLLERYQALISPHTPLVEGSPLANAEVRAATEIQQYLSSQNRCVKQCFEPAKTRDACTDSCMGKEMKDILVRVNACRKPTWLPQ